METGSEYELRARATGTARGSRVDAAAGKKFVGPGRVGASSSISIARAAPRRLFLVVCGPRRFVIEGLEFESAEADGAIDKISPDRERGHANEGDRGRRGC